MGYYNLLLWLRNVVELSYFTIKCYGTFNNNFPFKIVANIMVWIYYHDTTLHVQKASFWKDKVRCISKHYLLEAQPKWRHLRFYGTLLMKHSWQCFVCSSNKQILLNWYFESILFSNETGTTYWYSITFELCTSQNRYVVFSVLIAYPYHHRVIVLFTKG